MAWEPKYPDLTLGLPLGRNIAKAIQRDGDAAVKWANGGIALPPFARVLLCERVSTKFPYCAVFPQHVQVLPSNEVGYYDVICDTVLEVCVQGTAPEALTEEIQTRMVAIFQLLLSMEEAELMNGIPYTSFTLPVRGLRADAFYEQVRQDVVNQGVYYRAAFWQYTINYQQFSE